MQPETLNISPNLGIKFAADLRNEGCEIIIALTHMRTPNDINLAENCPDIDLILGGHVYEIKEVNGVKIIKSGTDFRQFSKITLLPKRNDKGKIAVDVTSELAKYSALIEVKMTEILGTFTVELDGRFAAVRTQETNLGLGEDSSPKLGLTIFTIVTFFSTIILGNSALYVLNTNTYFLAAYCYRSLEMIDILLGCAIVLPNFFCDSDLDSIFNDFEEQMQKNFLGI
uniref:5'-Nucleotidase C-terminal domain-containing protein n=1 Tax=Glossina austeni TaxID=7395 RepID=A0A1A9UKX8_GLOAU